jgi:hypothetical protein
MTCGGGVQAFLPLPVGAALPPRVILAPGTDPRSGPPNEAIVQLHRSHLLTDTDSVVFQSGRLATRWFEPEVGPQMHELLIEQTRLIWTALRATTHPAAIEDDSGRRTTGFRIGITARQMVIDRQIPLTRMGWTRYRLTVAGSR